jgi:tRNA1Val (adenine37-N6)-methyltransferase
MANSFFQFKQFIIHQDACAMKVTTDSCLFGSIVGSMVNGTLLKNVLDIGAGTGLLSLMIAQQYPDVLIDAIEIDDAAASQAVENIQASPWKDQIRIFHTDIKNYKEGKKYDLIISNPPFYENELRSPDDRKNMAHHQTHLRSVDLLQAIKENLSSTGKYLLLLPFKKKEEWILLLKDSNLEPHHLVYLKQTINHPSFFRIIISGGIGNVPIRKQETVIVIKDAKNQYMEAFSHLLKDFYLQL